MISFSQEYQPAPKEGEALFVKGINIGSEQRTRSAAIGEYFVLLNNSTFMLMSLE